MQKLFINLAIVILTVSMVSSCQTEIINADALTKPDPTPEIQDKLVLYFPEVSSPGEVTTIHATIAEVTDQQTIFTWYADDFNFPQSVRENDIVTTPATASFLFEFPYLPEQAYYYVRCSAIREDGNIFEKTVKIQSIK